MMSKDRRSNSREAAATRQEGGNVFLSPPLHLFWLYRRNWVLSRYGQPISLEENSSEGRPDDSSQPRQQLPMNNKEDRKGDNKMTAPDPKPWKYRPYPGYDVPLQERLSSFQRRPEFLVFVLRILSAVVLRLWLRLYHRFRVEGRENLPRQGSFILVANHASHLDVLCLLSAMPLRRLHQTYPAGAADYFFSSLPRALAAATFANALPFDRKKDSSASLQACRQILAKPGNVLALFPEGTRAPDGHMGRFRSGIGRLAAGQEFPVIPCYLEGAGRAWPKGRRLPLPGRLRLRIGQPHHYSEIPHSRQGAQDIAGDLQEAVAALAEQ